MKTKRQDTQDTNRLTTKLTDGSDSRTKRAKSKPQKSKQDSTLNGGEPFSAAPLLGDREFALKLPSDYLLRILQGLPLTLTIGNQHGVASRQSGKEQRQPNRNSVPLYETTWLS